MARLVVPAGAVDLTRLGLTSVVMTFVEDSGPRGVVDVRVGVMVDGHPGEAVVPMLVHANAGFTVMLTHDALRELTGHGVVKESEFGLGHDLRVSDLGRGSTVLRSLAVGGSRLADVPCEVFQLPTSNWAGMLGTDWLAVVRPVVDFSARRLCVPTPQQRAALAALLDVAGTSVALDRDGSTGRYVAAVSLDPDNVTESTFVVSTVAATILDLAYARRQGLALEGPVGEDHGPAGAVVPVFRPTEPISFHAGGRLLGTVMPQVHDIHAYAGRVGPPGKAAVVGYLGADLMLDAGAVLDLGA